MLPLGFYENKSTVALAKDLLGTILVHDSDEGPTMGKIVETEAYLFNDAASHAFRGETKRNFHMFGPPGHAYIYQIYGIHYCFNIVSNIEGIGEAVLVRALEPVKGIELMMKRRNIQKEINLCNGPGKLVQAMGINKRMSGLSLISDELHLLPPQEKNKKIIASTRIGISKAVEMEYRYYLAGNKYVGH